MRTMQGCTVIGYDVDTGKELFVWPNVAPRHTDGTGALPHADQSLEHDGRQYVVIGVREGSTETLWKIDVRERPSK